MKAAYRSIVITPEIGMPIAGNVRIDNKSRGIHDDLFCNVIILNNEETRVCFLGFDICEMDTETSKIIVKKISKKTGIKKENVIISATHTHSGPDSTDIFKDGVCPEGIEYNNWLITYIPDEVSKIAKNYEEVTLKIGKSEVFDLSFNRRLVMKDGSVKMNFEEFDNDDVVGTTGPIDPELLTISLWNNQNELKAVMVNFALHPAVLVGYKWLISRDYINDLDETIKDKYNKDVVVLFANGAEGNINHINYNDERQKRGFEEAKRIGIKLAKYVYSNIENAKTIANVDDMACITEEIELPMRKLTEKDMEWAKMVLKRDKDKVQDLIDGVPDLTYAKEYFKMKKTYTPLYKTLISVVKIGDCVIATLPGEVFVEIGLEIKDKSKFDTTFVFGLTNECAGYIPNEKAFSEGGYEIVSAGSSMLATNTAQILEKEVIDLVNRI